MTSFFKRPQAINVSVKGIRGLTTLPFVVQSLLADAEYDLAKPLVESEVALEPGEEVEARVVFPSPGGPESRA